MRIIKVASIKNSSSATAATTLNCSIAHAKNLGFTDEMISSMWPNLEGAL
jgi:hypothetical protein